MIYSSDKKKLCLVLNVAPHYRKGIFEKIDEVYDAYFVASLRNSDIRSLDMSNFAHPVAYTRDLKINGIRIWQFGILKYVFKDFESYLVSEDIHKINHWLFLLLCKVMGKKTYAWTHGWYGRESRAKSWIKKRFFSLFTGIFLYGDYARELMVAEGFAPDKLWVIHNSLDYACQLGLRQSDLLSDVYKTHFGGDKRVILFIGRLTVAKKLEMLIEAMPLLKEEFNLVFVGEGVDKQKLEHLVSEKGLNGRVWFYGSCYDERTNAKLIYNADICVSPGNVGLTAIHAMVFGTPVISHNCFKWQGPEFEAIKPGVTGDFFEYDNVGSMVDAILKWFDMHTERNAVREACFHEIDTRWNPEVQTKVFLENIK